MAKRKPTYEINGLTLREYFKSEKVKITAIDGWQDKTDEIVYAVRQIAPNVPRKVLEQAFNKSRKIWMTVDDEVFDKLFEKE